MKKNVFTVTTLTITSLILSGCMTTGPIIDDLNHYKEGDTYESIRENHEEESTITSEDIEEGVEEKLDDEMNNNDTGIIENSEGQIVEEAVVQE